MGLGPSASRERTRSQRRLARQLQEGSGGKAGIRGKLDGQLGGCASAGRPAISALRAEAAVRGQTLGCCSGSPSIMVNAEGGVGEAESQGRVRGTHSRAAWLLRQESTGSDTDVLPDPVGFQSSVTSVRPTVRKGLVVCSRLVYRSLE